MPSPEQIETALHRILLQVQKPGRYVGGELNAVVKPWDEAGVKAALVFPDIYDIGVSNVGLKILYDQINQRPDALAERAYAPWTDMEALMRQDGIPAVLTGIEAPARRVRPGRLLAAVRDALHQYPELSWTSPGIPVRSADRDDRHPIVIAGGHAATNPEPMHAFVDAFVIGEGEEVIHEIIDVHAGATRPRCRPSKATPPSGSASRDRLLRALAELPGVYVPKVSTRCTTCRMERLRTWSPWWRASPIQSSSASWRQLPPPPDPVHRAQHRDRPQPGVGGDHARLHARLPVLPGRHDHAAGPRAQRGRDRAGGRGGRATPRASRSWRCCRCRPPISTASWN